MPGPVVGHILSVLDVFRGRLLVDFEGETERQVSVIGSKDGVKKLVATNARI